MDWDWSNWVRPSSIQAKRFSSEPTIIGNHMCPISWVVTSYMPSVSHCPPMQVIIGYSMPPHELGPSTAVMCGYGYGQRYFE